MLVDKEEKECLYKRAKVKSLDFDIMKSVSLYRARVGKLGC